MTDERTLSVIEGLERASRRSRPFIIIGLVAIIAAFAAMAVYLYQQRSAAERRVTDAQVRADRLEAAYKALEGGNRELARQLLQGAIEQEQQIAAPETPVAARPAQVPLASLQVDIFHCAGADRRVLGMARRMQAGGGRDGGTRRAPRLLPLERNAHPIYRLSRNELRYNPEEEDAADRLLAEVRATGVEVAKVLTYFNSPRRISIFFCQGATPPPQPSAVAAATPGT